MSEFKGGEKPYKPGAIKMVKRGLGRVATAGLIVVGSALTGAIAEATTGVVSKTAGNITQAGKEMTKGVLTATGDLLDRNNSITQGQVDQIRQNLEQRAAKDKAEGVTAGKPTK